jgi:hypothetical protein
VFLICSSAAWDIFECKSFHQLTTSIFGKEDTAFAAISFSLPSPDMPAPICSADFSIRF